MSLSHQNREDETLLDYFKQMLTVESHEIDKAQVPPPPSSETLDNKTQKTVQEELLLKQPLSQESVFKPQLQKIEKESALPKVEYAQAPSLEQLLSSIETAETQESAVAQESKVETKTLTATDVAEVVETATQTLEATPKLETQVETEAKTSSKTQVATDLETKIKVKPQVEVKTEVKAEVQKTASKQDEKISQALTQAGASQESREVFETWQNIDIGREFQTLFFVVGGVRFAVPLIDLGSIFETTKLTYIFGQPNWFLGMTDIRGKKINVVDTLRFVKEDYEGREEPYPYIITLGTSRWALTCDKLEGNRTILKDAVKWRQSAGSRPWLAGIVKEQMCALIHVQALIKLFETGFNPRMLDQIKDLS